ncbi:MAG: ABC transporter substrate-binding protein, partial [Acidimicrobiales bacterium]
MALPDPISRRTFLSRGAATGGIILVAAGAPTGLAACSSGAAGSGKTTGAPSGKPGVSTASPQRGGSAVIGTAAEIDGFFPPSSHWDNNGFLYANTVYDPLTALAADGTVKPYLAESIIPNSTYTAWTLTLRPGITFHDGSPLDSRVVKNNFDALKASPLTGTALKPLTSVTVSDPMTVVYHFDEPFVTLPASLSTQVGYVVGQAMLDAAVSSPSKAPHPVGTGPFIYSQWLPNSHFTATRNPHYWRSGYPYLDSVTYRPIPDTTQREATLRTGGVDLIVSSQPETVDLFTGQSGYQVVDSLSIPLGEPSMQFIMLNCLAAPTNDLRVRQALAKATDQAQVIKLFGGGLTKLADGLFPA